VLAENGHWLSLLIDVDLYCGGVMPGLLFPGDFLCSLSGARPRARRAGLSVRVGSHGPAGPAAGLRDAIRTAAPVRDFGFIDLVATVVSRRETWRIADRAVHVDHASTDSADQMVMVVADAIFESRG